MNKLASILTILILWVSGASATTHPTFEEGAQLFVVAQSGLSLRAEPGSHKELITIIPYGEVVQILKPDSIMLKENINWVSGQWIPVHYDGHIGYVFDGYLSPLTLPSYSFEKAQSDLNLIYPLESWVGVHLHAIGNQDTVTTDYYDQVTQMYESGDQLTRMNAGNLYKVKLNLKDVRIMDVYHLLKSMLNNRYEIDHFEKSSLFLADEGSDLKRIKIQLENPVDIRYTAAGNVLVTITSQEYECDLLTDVSEGE